MNIAADSEALLDRAAMLIAGGREAAAWPVLEAARNPASGRWAELAGLVQLRADRLDAARDILDSGIIAAPDNAGLRLLRAEVLQRLGHLTEALGDAAEGVILDRGNATAKALLGTLLLQAGQVRDALTCLAEAAAAEPTRAAFRCGLAAAHEAAGDPARAANCLEDAIAAIPHDLALRNDAVLLAVRHRRFSDAVSLAKAARAAGIADACLFGLLGHSLSSLGRHAEAADAYRDALKLGPDDPYVRHLVAAAGIVPDAPHAPAEYVRTVFDGYAPRFEAHLLSLGYRVPGLLRAALLRHRAGPFLETLDLGCGTGLMGVVLADLAPASLIGVDLSPAMLRQAQTKGLYAALHEAEIGAFLRGTTARFPLILAADVLCYFGDLSDILSLIAARLAPGGLFLASLEETQDVPGWRLGPAGRYAHHADYLRHCATHAGVAVLEITRESLRQEAGADVAGLIVVVEAST